MFTLLSLVQEAMAQRLRSAPITVLAGQLFFESGLLYSLEEIKHLKEHVEQEVSFPRSLRLTRAFLRDARAGQRKRSRSLEARLRVAKGRRSKSSKGKCAHNSCPKNRKHEFHDFNALDHGKIGHYEVN